MVCVPSVLVTASATLVMLDFARLLLPDTGWNGTRPSLRAERLGTATTVVWLPEGDARALSETKMSRPERSLLAALLLLRVGGREPSRELATGAA